MGYKTNGGKLNFSGNQIKIFIFIVYYTLTPGLNCMYCFSRMQEMNPA